MSITEEVAAGVREVTDEEVAFAAEHGWVRLPGLLSPELAGQLLQHAKALMGDEGAARVNEPSTLLAATFFESFNRPGDVDPLFREVYESRTFGANTARLLGRDSGIRMLTHTLAVKLPVSAQPDRGQPTDFHQDYSRLLPFDRNSLGFWIALDEVTPDQGPLQFYSGSHKLGLLGGAKDILAYPRIHELELSAPPHLMAGDATAHFSLTVHGATENASDRPRWAQIVHNFPADTLFTGKPNKYTKDLDVEPFSELDFAEFPVIYQPAA